VKYQILLHPASEAGTGDPAKPAIEPKAATPPATDIVLDGKKSEREIELEQEVTKLKQREKQLETDNAHLADTVSQLKQIPAAKPAPTQPAKPAALPANPAPAPAQAKTKGSWTFFG